MTYAGIAAFSHPGPLFVNGTLALGQEVGHHPNVLTVVPAERVVG
jgi:hypothetical protein